MKAFIAGVVCCLVVVSVNGLTSRSYAPTNTNHPERLYSHLTATFGPRVSENGMSAQLLMGKPLDLCTYNANLTAYQVTHQFGFGLIVRRGGCTFIDKAKNAQSYGAKFLIIANNENDLIRMGIPPESEDDISVPVVCVSDDSFTRLNMSLSGIDWIDTSVPLDGDTTNGGMPPPPAPIPTEPNGGAGGGDDPIPPTHPTHSPPTIPTYDTASMDSIAAASTVPMVFVELDMRGDAEASGFGGGEDNGRWKHHHDGEGEDGEGEDDDNGDDQLMWRRSHGRFRACQSL